MRLVESVLPILRWSKSYDLRTAIGDLIAGITVALTLIPQSIAYASLAGFEPQVIFATCRFNFRRLFNNTELYLFVLATNSYEKFSFLNITDSMHIKNTMLLVLLSLLYTRVLLIQRLACILFIFTINCKFSQRETYSFFS